MAGGQVTFNYQIGAKSIGGFQIDAFLVEKYSFSNKPTELPVEEGSNISDHVTDEPDTLSLEAFIGQAEFKVYDGAIPEDLSQLDIPDQKTRIRQAYHELLRMKREKQPVDVVTGLDTFTNMIITSLEIDRSVETGANLPFSMTFQNIKTVSSEETDIAASPSVESAEAPGNMGPTGKQEPEKEDFHERVWYSDWKRTGGKNPKTADFVRKWQETPEQFAAKFGGKVLDV